jgi:hypothetical protein
VAGSLALVNAGGSASLIGVIAVMRRYAAK